MAERSFIKFNQKENVPLLYEELEKEKTLTNLNCSNALWKGNPKMLNHVIVMASHLANAPVAFCAKHSLLLPEKTHLNNLLFYKLIALVVTVVLIILFLLKSSFFISRDSASRRGAS